MDEAHKLEIGERIKGLREQSRYGQQAVAEKLGIGLRAYQHMEAVGTTKYERCQELAEIFEVEADWIWNGREKGATPDPFLPTEPIEARLAALEDKVDRLLVIAEGILGPERNEPPGPVWDRAAR